MKLKFSLSSLVKGYLQILLVIVVLALGVAANFFLVRSPPASVRGATGPEAVLVEVIQPETISAPIRVKESGVVQSRNTVGLTPQVSGQVLEISDNLASGGEFVAGEILFRLDPADYLAEVDRAKAEVSSAEANLMVELAEADIAKQEWAVVHPGEAAPSLVAREPQIAQARASLQSAEARLRTAGLSLQRVDFSLPFSGRIVESSVELGQRLSANQTYGKAYAYESVEVSVPVDAEILAALEPVVGREARVYKESRRNPSEYAATVKRVEAELDAVTRLGRAIVGFVDPAEVVPGTFVTVEIVGPVVEDAYVLPEQAMSEARYAWVVKDGRLRQQSLEILGLREDQSFIVAPFDAGEGIVISPLTEPVESTPARIVNREASQ